MRMQIYIIVFLLSAIAWVMSFDVTRMGYRDAWHAGLMPDLHIRHHLHKVL
jgi:hypothetical protein